MRYVVLAALLLVSAWSRAHASPVERAWSILGELRRRRTLGLKSRRARQTDGRAVLLRLNDYTSNPPMRKRLRSTFERALARRGIRLLAAPSSLPEHPGRAWLLRLHTLMSARYVFELNLEKGGLAEAGDAGAGEGSHLMGAEVQISILCHDERGRISPGPWRDRQYIEFRRHGTRPDEILGTALERCVENLLEAMFGGSPRRRLTPRYQEDSSSLRLSRSRPSVCGGT